MPCHPATLEISAGDRVVWVNYSLTQTLCSTSTQGIWNSSIRPGCYYSYTFPSSGSYPYTCCAGSGVVNAAVPTVSETPVATATVCDCEIVEFAVAPETFTPTSTFTPVFTDTPDYTDTPTNTPTDTFTPTPTVRCEYSKVEKGIGAAVGAGTLDDCVYPTRIAYQDPNVEGVIENTTAQENVQWTSGLGSDGFFPERGGSYIIDEMFLPFASDNFCINLASTAVAQASTTPSPSDPYAGQGNWIDALTTTPFSGGTTASSRVLGERGIYFKDTVLNDPLIVSGGYFAGCGTLVVEGSDIYVNGDVFIATPDPDTELVHCLGFIACKDPVSGEGGNIYFDQAVTEASGNFLAEDTIYTGASSSNPIVITGSLTGDKVELERSIDFFVNPLWTPVPSDHIIYNPGLLNHPPAGFYDPDKVRFIEWIEIPPV